MLPPLVAVVALILETTVVIITVTGTSSFFLQE